MMNENEDVIAMLCRRIKLARIEKNLSQVELAERAEIGIATMKRVELGESITLHTLISVLRGLDELDQLNNLLAHQEPIQATGEKNTQQRKRKVTGKTDTVNQKTSSVESSSFITTHINNMHWKSKGL